MVYHCNDLAALVESAGVEPASRTRKPYAFYTLSFDLIFELR